MKVQRWTRVVFVGGKARLQDGHYRFTKPMNRHEHRMLEAAQAQYREAMRLQAEAVQLSIMHDHNPTACLPTSYDLELVRRYHIQKAARELKERRLAREFSANRDRSATNGREANCARRQA